MRLIGFTGATTGERYVAARVFGEMQNRGITFLHFGFENFNNLLEELKKDKSLICPDVFTDTQASDIKNAGGIIIEILDSRNKKSVSLSKFVDYTVTDCGILREYIDTLRILYKRIASLGER